MILAHPWWVGVGFHTPFRCSDEPKALRVEPHPPEQELFHNASRACLNMEGQPGAKSENAPAPRDRS
ncbi:hypothetical protein CHM34_08100 [Paludifilum halophilum]|uniref:Uncharacterized protein n=1 Tax=Paludifilum halophilum TaxID=1642702 RepID=A0A235B6Z5_9BACL|nr:hypothetical protein CHM34_08100 [Paludifilum halophilum]